MGSLIHGPLGLQPFQLCAASHAGSCEGVGATTDFVEKVRQLCMPGRVNFRDDGMLMHPGRLATRLTQVKSQLAWTLDRF